MPTIPSGDTCLGCVKVAERVVRKMIDAREPASYPDARRAAVCFAWRSAASFFW